MLRREDLLSVFLLLLVGGCYPGISGRVVESETGKPVPGAIVVAEWESSHGMPGLTYKKTYKIVETQTDTNGAFSLSGVYNPLVNAPMMIIYKDGYVPWSNDFDFEKSVCYDETIWKDGLTYKLNKWKPSYSKKQLNLFLSGITGANSQDTPLYKKIIVEGSKQLSAERRDR